MSDYCPACDGGDYVLCRECDAHYMPEHRTWPVLRLSLGGQVSAPDDLDRRRRHRQPRPASHWGPPGDLTPHPGDVSACPICHPKETP